VIEPSQVRILAYLHVSHTGIFGFSHRAVVGESEETRLMNPIDAVSVAEANRDVIVGQRVISKRCRKSRGQLSDSRQAPPISVSDKMEALIASSFGPKRITANRRSLRRRVLPVKIKEAPIERLLLARSGRSHKCGKRL
jgi:hypothetical protein